jgi:hypothetical protein
LVYLSRAYGRGDTVTVEWYNASGIREGASVELSRDGSSVNQLDLWCTDEPIGPAAADFWIAGSNLLRNVATAAAFVNSFNLGLEAETLALIDDRIGSIADCDYRAGVVRVYNGKQGVAAWLRERLADHDQITIGTVSNHGGHWNTVGVDWGHRSSDTLRSLGLSAGINPGTVAKLQYSIEGTRLMTLMLSPYPGQYNSDTICRLNG